MFSKNRNRAPSPFEVGLAAVLSIILGLVVAVVLLAIKPVPKVAALPKDPPPGQVYYIEGNTSAGRISEVNAKRKRFVAGDSVALQEGEINVFIAANTPAAGAPPKPDTPAPKPGAKPTPTPKPDDKDPAAPAVPDKLLTIGALNCRIAGGKIQFGAPVTVSVAGIAEQVFAQTTGTFEKRGSEFVFTPETTYLGGCELSRVAPLRDLVLNKLLFTQPIPNDIYAAWSKLAAATLDGNTLHLRMP